MIPAALLLGVAAAVAFQLLTGSMRDLRRDPAECFLRLAGSAGLVGMAVVALLDGARVAGVVATGAAIAVSLAGTGVVARIRGRFAVPTQSSTVTPFQNAT